MEAQEAPGDAGSHGGEDVSPAATEGSLGRGEAGLQVGTQPLTPARRPVP